MAIEPLGSMTAAQVQSTIKVQTADPVKQDLRNMDDISNQSATPKMDETTAIVAKTSENHTTSDNNRQENSGTNSDTIKKAVENLNKNMNKNMNNTEAIFGIHEGTNRVTIKIIDRTTKKVIKELPPEKTLDMIEKVWEMAGILVDEKR